MGNIKRVQNGRNITIADERVFDFVYRYAKHMAIMEEVENNLSMLNQPYFIVNDVHLLMTIEMLNMNYQYVQDRYEEMDNDVQEEFQSNMQTYRRRTLTLINFIQKWEKSTKELKLAKQRWNAPR